MNIKKLNESLLKCLKEAERQKLDVYIDTTKGVLVEERIYVPTRDDERLDDLAEKGWEIEKLFNLDQPAGKYLTVYRNIQRALDKIKDTLKYDDRQLIQVGV